MKDSNKSVKDRKKLLENLKPDEGNGFPPREMDGYKIVMEKCYITKKKF